MKLNWSLKTPYSPLFRGNRELPEAEQIKTLLSPPTTMEVIEAADAFQRAGLEGGTVDTEQLSPAMQKAILNECGKLLPKYVEISNLEIDEGPVTPGQIACLPIFAPLAIELVVALIDSASPSEEDQGNSETLPDGSGSPELAAP